LDFADARIAREDGRERPYVFAVMLVKPGGGHHYAATSIAQKENAMAQEPLANKGNFLHIYDFRVQKGHEQDFITSFESFDYSDGNPMHKSKAQVKDGVLCRDTENPDHFYLIGEWRDIEEHRRIREFVAREIRPEFVQLIEGGHFVPNYAEIVSMTPQEVLDKAAAE